MRVCLFVLVFENFEVDDNGQFLLLYLLLADVSRLCIFQVLLKERVVVSRDGTEESE